MSRLGPLLLILSLGFCQAHEGYPVSIFAHVASRDYELLPDGTDSYVLKIGGMQNFYDEIVKSSKPVVLKFFSNASKDFMLSTKLFQDLAGEYDGEIKFASLDAGSNAEMLKRFTAFFVKLAMSMQSSKNQNGVLLSRVTELIKRLSSFDRSPQSMPFVLFFRNGNLIFPETPDFLPKDLFVASLKKQLLAPEPKEERASFWKKMSSEHKESLWQRIKSRTRSWWSKKKR